METKTSDERLARAGQLLMAAWNVLLIPAALVLPLQHRADGRTERARLATVCGIASLLFWAFGGATHRITPALEPVPFSLYLTASPKLPLSILWDFALAYILLRPARRLATPQSVASAF